MGCLGKWLGLNLLCHPEAEPCICCFTLLHAAPKGDTPESCMACVVMHVRHWQSCTSSKGPLLWKINPPHIGHIKCRTIEHCLIFQKVRPESSASCDTDQESTSQVCWVTSKKEMLLVVIPGQRTKAIFREPHAFKLWQFQCLISCCMLSVMSQMP
jgi:hypothetical protein